MLTNYCSGNPKLIEEPDRDSYLEVCEQGELHRVSPRNHSETKIHCEDIVQFNFKKGEKSKRIRVYGVFLVLDAVTGCPKRVLFGHGQCKDIEPGVALRILKDGLWKNFPNQTLSVMLNIKAANLQAFRLPSPTKQVVTIPEASTFFTLGGDIADLPGKKGAYCLLDDHVNHTKIISQKFVMRGGTIQFGGTPDECPYSKFFSKALHTSPQPINLPTVFDTCELPCESEQEDGAGPGPVEISEAKAENELEPASREDATIPPEVIDDPLATLKIELDTANTTPFVEDTATTTLAPLPPDDEEVALPKERKRRGAPGPPLCVSCEKTFKQKCTTGISSYDIAKLEKMFG